MGEVLSKYTRAIAACLTLAVLFSAGPSPAALQEVELFEKAYEYYLSYHPKEAMETFDLFIRQFPKSSALDSALFWRAKALVHLKKFDDAAIGFQAMKDLSPVSPYIAFADKELEALRKMPPVSGPHHAGQEPSSAQSDGKVAGVDEKIRGIEKDGQDLGMRFADAERGRQQTERDLTKALEDKSARIKELEGRLKEEAETSKGLQAEKASLLKELSEEKKKTAESANQAARQQMTAQEIARAQAETQRLRAETDALQGKVRELESAEKERAGLQAEIREKDLRLSKANETSARLATEKQVLEERLKEKDAKLAQASETISSLQGSVQSLQLEKGNVLVSLQEKQKQAETEKILREEELKKDQKNIAARLAEEEKRVKEQEGTISRLTAEKAALERQLSAGRANAPELKALQEENVRLRDDNSRLMTAKVQTELDLKKASEEKALLSQAKDRDIAELRKITHELAEARKPAEAQAKKVQELQQEVGSLRAQIKDYEEPVFRIGTDRYSLWQVISEAKLSAGVKRKIKAPPAPWAGKGVMDTVINEEVLYRKARQLGIKENKNEQDALARQYGLDAKEHEYLAKYLVIDSLYKRKSAELSVSVSEEEMREYYEQHGEEFTVSPAGKTVRILAVAYRGADELEKSLVAVELHRQALGGRRLEEIANNHLDMASFREAPFGSLPEWVREKLQQLREGEVSTVISSGSELMIMQVQYRQAAFKPYQDVRTDIEKKLSAHRESRGQQMEEWLNSMAGEMEIIR